jgi:hypothetical protein
MKSFFVISTIRSGSTAIAALCNTAKNCWCGDEELCGMPQAVWNVIYDKSFCPDVWIDGVVGGEVKMANDNGMIYGAKYPLQYPMVPHLYNRLNCKFVYLLRDGREVVRSMLNWNQQATGTVYLECREPEKYVGKAAARRKTLARTIYSYYPDAVRPRPFFDDPDYSVDDWLKLSRIEMYSYYWAKVHETVQGFFNHIPKQNVFTLDMSADNRVKKADEMIDWLEFDDADSLANLRPDHNSLESKDLGDSTSYKHWKHWDSETLEKFNRFAGPMMQRLGYED